MLKAFFLALVFLAVPISSTAQPLASQLLEEKLARAKSDTSRINLLNHLSLEYLTNDLAKSLESATRALELSRKVKFTSGEIVALNRLGENEFRRSQHASAFSLATQSLKLAETVKDSVNLAYAYRLLGLINTLGLKQYDLALDYQLKALQIFKRTNDPQRLASLYGNISWIYAIMDKNLPIAMAMARKGVHIADSLKDDRLVSYNYNSIAIIHKNEKQLDSAIIYIDRSNLFAQKAGDLAVVGYNQIIKGEVFLMLNKYHEAIEKYRDANNRAKTLSMAGLSRDAKFGLAKSFEAIGDFKAAYRNYLEASNLDDSLQSLTTGQKVLLTRLEFEQRQQQEKISELEAENTRSKKDSLKFLTVGIISFTSLIAIVVLVIINNRQRAQTNLLLLEKNEEIASQNEQLKEVNQIKNKLFSIIGHDLRSPLNSLKGMLDLAIRNKVSSEEFSHFAPKLYQHVVGVGETLENLLLWSKSQMEGWTNKRVAINVFEVVEKTLSLFNETATEKAISLRNDVNRNYVGLMDENQLELVLRNLVHNAIKFTNKDGTIHVDANESNDFIDITIRDNGSGMSKEKVDQLFKVSTGSISGTFGEKGTGLGLILCKEMVENNDGRIAVVSEEGKGTCFTVSVRKA